MLTAMLGASFDRLLSLNIHSESCSMLNAVIRSYFDDQIMQSSVAGMLPVNKVLMLPLCPNLMIFRMIRTILRVHFPSFRSMILN